MVKEKKSIKQKAQTLAIILMVVIAGCYALGFGLSYYYKDMLEGGACGLCSELNPNYTKCMDTGGGLPLGVYDG